VASGIDSAIKEVEDRSRKSLISALLNLEINISMLNSRGVLVDITVIFLFVYY
jgi:hypothetical protein